jgi:hypothetical protein
VSLILATASGSKPSGNTLAVTWWMTSDPCTSQVAAYAADFMVASICRVSAGISPRGKARRRMAPRLPNSSMGVPTLRRSGSPSWV